MKILAMVLVWALIFTAGFVLPRFIEPTGDGFTRGLNRLPYFFALHCVGFLGAVLIAVYSTRSMSDIAKWLLVTGFAPLAAYVLLIGLFVVVYIGAIVTGL